jgi:hypothetical protein
MTQNGAAANAGFTGGNTGTPGLDEIETGHLSRDVLRFSSPTTIGVPPRLDPRRSVIGIQDLDVSSFAVVPAQAPSMCQAPRDQSGMPRTYEELIPLT